MIADLRLQHFRSYGDESFEFDPGVNIIVGPNASGKTNLLEALLVLALGSSYRAKDAELIQFNKPWSRLEAHLPDASSRIVKLVAAPPGKSYDISGKPFRRMTLAHSLPVVLFEPNHLLLLVGPPEQRRNYLDDLLEQTTPGYQAVRQQYARTVRQRNALLKRAGPALSTQLFPWNIRMGELGGKIVRARFELAERLNKQVGKLYRDLSATKGKVGLSYEARFEPAAYESQLLKKLEASVELDAARGFTGAGPHREDLAVLFGGRPAALAASRGETRTAVLALKILELKLLEAVRGRPPLLLLDDVFSELDGKRRRALTAYLRDYQTFITTTDADVVVQNFTETRHIIPLGGQSSSAFKSGKMIDNKSGL